MNGNDIYYMFSLMFPKSAENVRCYEECDNNSILLHMRNFREFVFTYNSVRSWLLETYEHYQDRTAAVQEV